MVCIKHLQCDGVIRIQNENRHTYCHTCIGRDFYPFQLLVSTFHFIEVLRLTADFCYSELVVKSLISSSL